MKDECGKVGTHMGISWSPHEMRFIRNPIHFDFSPSDQWTWTFSLSNFLGITQMSVRGTLPSKQISWARNHMLHLVQSPIFPTIPKNSWRFKFLVVWLQKPTPTAFIWFMCQLSPLPSWSADSVLIYTSALECSAHVLSPLSLPSPFLPSKLQIFSLYRAMQLCTSLSYFHYRPTTA